MSDPERRPTEYNIQFVDFAVGTLSTGKTYLFYIKKDSAQVYSLVQKNVDNIEEEKILVKDRCSTRVEFYDNKVYFLWKNPVDDLNLCTVVPDTATQNNPPMLVQKVDDFTISDNYLYYTSLGNNTTVWRGNPSTGKNDIPITNEPSRDIYAFGKYLYYNVLIDKTEIFKRAPIDGSNPAGTVVS